MKRLAPGTVAALPDLVRRPAHAMPAATGIVHFGPGAFHRAHQAAYIDTVLDHDPRWGIAAVSLRSWGTVEALDAQDGLYTIGIRGEPPGWRLIAAHNRRLGPDQARETAALLADPAVRLVTTTVTEKGYCLRSDGTLDLAHPDIAHDLTGAPPRSVIGWIAAGLAARRTTNTAPFAILPCDNLAANGRKLHAALAAFARAQGSSLAGWIEDEVIVPSTMVDSITPASDAAFLAETEAALGVRDEAAVQREPFTQWVIEDRGAPLGPDLAAAGAIVTADLAGYERAKLRMLNGPHSTLAYAGLLRGHRTVAEAMRDPQLAAFVAAMIEREIVPTVGHIPGFDLTAYAADVLARFRNPMIEHRLEQIAIDGSQKLPYRLVDTLHDAQRLGMTPHRVIAAIGCWVAFLMTRARAGVAIIDAIGDDLARLASEGSGTAVTQRLAAAGYLRLPEAEIVSAIGAAADAAFAGNWTKVTA